MKYGPELSWGDLFVLAGNEAITSSGGYVLGFCGGRVDAPDGSESIQLGPSDIQGELSPCAEQGNCQEPLGANTIGLIYVNPEGHQADGDPVGSAADIRDVFGRMDMNDRETVALIGGGHTIGKTHGACPAGAGPSPAEDPFNPWPGYCGDGKLENAFTSGFELPFTSRPTAWDTEYFDNLVNFEWEMFVGDGGHKQWRWSSGLIRVAQTDLCCAGWRVTTLPWRSLPTVRTISPSGSSPPTWPSRPTQTTLGSSRSSPAT